MYTFNNIWSLLEPKIEYANLINKCKELWDSLSPEKQEEIYLKIEKKKLEKKFVDYNPLLALGTMQPEVRNLASKPSPSTTTTPGTARPNRATDGGWRTRQAIK